MADVFDPNMDPEEFAIRQALSRAAALRKQPAPAEGQMISGQYVRAPKLAGFVPILNNLVAENIERNAVQQQQALTGRQRDALNEWLAGRPTKKTTYGAGEAGPTMTTTEPSEADTTVWAAQGLKNPLARSLASKVIEDQIVQAPIRADKLADKLENTRLVNQRFDEDRKARAQLAAENSKNRLDLLQARLSTVGADTAARLELQRQIANENNALRKYQIESGIEQRTLDRQSQEGIAANRLAAKVSPEKPLTEGQSKALLFGTRMQEANDILDDLSTKGVTTSIPGSRVGGVGAVISAFQSEDLQKLDQAKRDFINAVLRRESGAVISDQEFANAEKQYFPQIGDKEGSIAQKKRNREVAMRGILAEVPDAENRSGQIREPARPSALPKSTAKVDRTIQASRDQGAAETLLNEIRSGANVTRQADYDSLVRELKRTGYKGEIPPMKIGGATNEPAAAPKTLKWSDLK